jgi:hypothetical protein
MGKELNAMKTGAHSRAMLLPWESAQEFEKLRAEIFADLCPQGRVEEEIIDHIVQNRWMRQRQQQTTAIGMHRHAFAKELEEAKVDSWREAVSVLRKRDSEGHEILKLLDAKIAVARELLAKASDVSTESEDELRKSFQILDTLSNRLAAHDKFCKEVREFFVEYLPRHVESRIKNESSLDAQYDRLRTRLVIEQEARIRRSKLELEVAAKTLTKDMTDAARAPQGTRGRRGNQTEIAKAAPALGEEDPLAQFVEEAELDAEELGSDDVA